MLPLAGGLALRGIVGQDAILKGALSALVSRRWHLGGTRGRALSAAEPDAQQEDIFEALGEDLPPPAPMQPRPLSDHPWLPGVADAEAAAAVAEEPPSDGTVQYRTAPIWQTICDHYAKLQRAMPDYTARVDLDTFGSLYVEQVRREEAARQAALVSHRMQVERDARAGRPSRQVGGVLSGLMRGWSQLLQEAVEAEQMEIISAGQQRRAASDDPRLRDRASYGPYLLLLNPQDVAVLAVHTVLTKVATTVPGTRDELEGSAAISAPAVLVAEALGSALNDRLKWIRYKAALAQARRELKERQRRQRGEKEGSSGSSSSDGGGDAPLDAAPGPRTTQSIEVYRRDAEGAVAMHAEGMARIQRLVKDSKLPRAWQKQVAEATQSASWDLDTKIKVGAALLSLMVENSPIQVPAGGLPGAGAAGFLGSAAPGAPRRRARGGLTSVPAFAYTYRRLEGSVKSQAFIEATPAMVHLLNTDGSLLAELTAKSPPMLIPPEPWTRYDTGGYLTYRTWMMRTRWSWHVKDELKRRLEGYRRVLDALNALGATPWKINRPIFEAMKALYDARSTAAGLPVQDPIKPPRAPGNTYRLIWEGSCLTARGGPPSAQERRTHRLAADEIRRLNRNIASLHADFKLKWGVANEYADCPEFYYPHTLDFRGRAYPMHPSLQHLGDDLCRGLLTFAHPRPLGTHGLDWLFVHFANLWGNGEDKRSFDDRRRFTRTHLPQLLACAQDPLTNVWWQEAEKPWQALACCYEIAGALASLDPEGYPSSLPVHMDGSCNGLQHYAALGRDEAGGRAVNLVGSDVPQDVYSGVAAIVAQRVEEDARAGVPEGVRLRGLVDRKLVKQTVMTSVYGVTAIGARAQIENRLRERGALDGDKEQLFKASRYLADHTMGAIGEMFSGAKGIMAWLADCAREVASYEEQQAASTGDGGEEAAAAAAGGGKGRSKAAQRGSSLGHPVKWVTPLGLPVTQPYFRTSNAVVSTVTQNFSVQRDDADRGSKVTKARQRSAFPPNYIHSLDSTHMMRTALRCRDAGITFAGVHDSFWTHAGTVSVMNRLLREEFVALHTECDLLVDLARQLREAHPGIRLPPVPPRGRLDVTRVKKSRYFFS